MTTQENIQNLVAANKVEQAIDEFINWANANDKEMSNQLILLKGRYNSLKRNENLGLMSFSESSQERARISNSVLELTNQIGAVKNPPPPQPPVGNIPISTPTPANSSTSKKILFLASNPSNTGKLQLDKEFRQVFQSVQEGTLDYEMVVEWAITPSDLQRVVLKHKPNILHFSGHGEGSKMGRKQGTGSIGKATTVPAGIILQDATGQGKLVSGVALANLFSICLRKFKIELVVLNACHSEEQAKGIAQAGVSFVVGMNTAVNDDTAIEFSTGLYRGVASEGDIEFAFDLAKNNIMLMGLEGDNIPVLYKK